MDSNRQLQVQRLHRRIQEYRPTEEEVQQLQRTHAELKAAIELKFQGSRINSQYRFPLKRQQEADMMDSQLIVCNLHTQNSKQKQRMVCSSMDQHISPEYSREGRTSSKPVRCAQTPTNFVSRTALQKRLKTDASDYSLRKDEADSETNISLLKRQLARTKTGRFHAGKENKEKFSQTLKKQSSKNCRKKQHRLLNVVLNDSNECISNLPCKIYPLSTKADRLDRTYDFNQSYQFQGLSSLAGDSTVKLANGLQSKSRASSRKEQFPSEKAYNDQQMKLLTNRMSREGRSIKNNYRLGVDDRRFLCTNH